VGKVSKSVKFRSLQKIRQRWFRITLGAVFLVHFLTVVETKAWTNFNKQTDLSFDLKPAKNQFLYSDGGVVDAMATMTGKGKMLIVDLPLGWERAGWTSFIFRFEKGNSIPKLHPLMPFAVSRATFLPVGTTSHPDLNSNTAKVASNMDRWVWTVRYTGSQSSLRYTQAQADKFLNTSNVNHQDVSEKIINAALPAIGQVAFPAGSSAIEMCGFFSVGGKLWSANHCLINKRDCGDGEFEVMKSGKTKKKLCSSVANSGINFDFLTMNSKSQSQTSNLLSPRRDPYLTGEAFAILSPKSSTKVKINHCRSIGINTAMWKSGIYKNRGDVNLRFYREIRCRSEVIPGDSGSVVIDRDGRAFGVQHSTTVTPDPQTLPGYSYKAFVYAI
jgi:hypothetical protein